MTTYVQNQGGVLSSEWLQYSPNGPLQDLDANPTITIQVLGGAIIVGPTATGVVHAATGVYTYDWDGIGDAGQYLVIWNGLSGGDPFQTNEIIDLITAAASGTVGPCAWDLSSVCCPDWDDYTSQVRAQATDYATLVLWSATGRQFGQCEITVRPCGRWCAEAGSAGWWWDYGTWIPYIYNGLWYNCACGFGDGCRTCRPHCQVYLPGPVTGISQVLLDGSVVDPATYRVDDQVWLVRTGDDSNGQPNCWPYKQDYNKPVSANHTMQVTMTRGTAPPAALLNAAGVLACEYAKACVGAQCRLPGRVTSVTRQGVSVNMTDVDMLLRHQLTGIKEVDDVIIALNPGGLKGRTRFYSPESPVNRMTTWP